MVDWRALTRRATGTAGRLFGSPVSLSFFKNGDVDPDRPLIEELPAQLHLPEEGDAKLGRSSSQFSTQVVAGTGLLILQRTDFGGRLITGDKVRGLGLPGKPWFEILSVDNAGADQIVAKLSLTVKG